MSEAGLPPGLLLAYYGDDFTGSTDALEAMTAAGLQTVLFLRTPTPDMLARFAGVRCIGIAGSSRGRSPEWMARELPPSFEALAALDPPILHYKVCSTFDSSATTGSIGRAIDIGVRHRSGRWSPSIVGVPRLRRYQAFGNLFASVDGSAHRLDRHPTMSRHPVTPMTEADLRRHLSTQTERRLELVDLVQLRLPDAAQRVEALSGPDVPVVFIDVLDDETLEAAGRLVWEQRGTGLFSASSSGLQYALAAHWRRQGWLPEPDPMRACAPVPAIAAVSGSCSPVTAAQIAWARARGFCTERLDIARVLDPARCDAELERVAGIAIDALSRGTSAIVFTAEGPDDPCVRGFAAIASAAGLSHADAARGIGAALGAVMRRLLDRTALTRVVVAGGDSSGEVASALGVDALTVVSALAPGVPLCRCWAGSSDREGLEIALKGGQMGAVDFFGIARDGTG
ncbi:four-carbon acid sugar kinase family protein [Variovorax sp. J22P168]|uniref:3-oxo-isoapionate kinase OiaK n=1 Tax=Variovorax jilinensis TaxID=3053513 RepID=UPI002578ECED|nr:3-oxo-isoapionate kinase OiaK [Variovorax sp. J22P168]MDM0014914.1 four-carbon acid sugar kinase family protein [Variovorax sp. J22P168]